MMEGRKGTGIKVAVDARWIFEKMSGVGRVTKNLILHLPQVDDRNRYVFIFDDERRMKRVAKECGLAEFSNVETVAVPYGIFSLKNQLKLPRLLKKLDVDVFHSTNFMIPLRRCRPKMIVTIHDLIPLLFPQYTPRSKKRRFFFLYKLIMKRIVRLADIIVADSENTRQDVIRNFAFPSADKTRVVHCGIARKYFDRAEEREPAYLRERYGIEGDIIIAAGRADPYKNTLGLVKAFVIVLREKELRPHLVIVGEEDERYPEVRDYVEENGLSEHVTFTGYLDEGDLVRAYASADVMVHPSMYEGFGLPALESMAAGTPVISSNAGSLPEVLGDAAVFVEPADEKGMAAAMTDLLTQPEKRRKMAERGREWARRYKWEDAARKTVQIYEEAAGDA